MISVLDEFILDVLVHHVESIFHIILRPTWHLLDDLRPLVADGEPLLQDQDVLR